VTSRPATHAPTSTYRLQLHREFAFRDAEAVLDYLEGIGITHLYLSPITVATPGSMHGYDVVDPTRINPELGGEEGFRALSSAACSRGMGILLDIVPNHMSTGEPNERWMDVLRNGGNSRFAHWFDIDWQTRDEIAKRGKILLPVLGDKLEAVLQRGELSVEESAGSAYLRYFDRRFPLAPDTATAIADATDEAGIRRLLEDQHYVLQYWRAAKAHVNYRRFFTIDELIGVRVEDVDVFDATHELFARLMREGLIAGVRVDHADGLSDPATYFHRLRTLLGPDAYIVAEKILAPQEQLPADWPIDGTTGYDFMAATGVLTDTRNEQSFHNLYTELTGRSTSFDELTRECRQAVIDGALSGQFQEATGQLYRALQPAVEYAPFQAALRELLSSISVYRTYHSPEHPDPLANEVIEAARRDAAESSPWLDARAASVVVSALSTPPPAALTAVMRLQQLMPAIQAKAVEDRAFYRYVPLLSLNEVGSDPGHFGRSVAEFHAGNLERARHWPASMLATATHDHKRGEDVRARLHALSEVPEGWAEFVARCRAATDVTPPSTLDEYMLYQTIAGLWPALGAPLDEARLVERLQAYAIKAAREAGEHTDWDAPDAGYEAALTEFTAGAVRAVASNADSLGLLGQLASAGVTNSLAQVVLKTMAPGVTDTYQGADLWDLSLVDPDNRRPVDYSERATLLQRLRPLLQETADGIEARRDAVPKLLGHAEDGAMKLYVLARALRLRRALHPLGTAGEYIPIEVRGPRAEHVIAFARRHEGRAIVAAVTRLPLSLPRAPHGDADWGDTALLLPAAFAASLRNLLTEEAATPIAGAHGAMLPVRAIFGVLPVALLQPDGGRLTPDTRRPM